MADAALARVDPDRPAPAADQASKHAHVRHRANLEVGLGRMLAVAEMQLRATAATNDDLGDALAEDRRRLLDAALCALAEARALGEPSEAAKRRRRARRRRGSRATLARAVLRARRRGFRRHRRRVQGRGGGVRRRLGGPRAPRGAERPRGAGERAARRSARLLQEPALRPATPPRPRWVHGCVEFIVDGVVRASSVAAFGDAGSLGCSVHAFAPPVPFKTKADRGGNVTYDGFHQPVVIQDFEVRALAVADRYACSWTGHSDERREWQQIHAVDDRDEPRPCDCFESLRPGKRRKIVGDEPYFDSMLAVLETRVPVDKDCSVCAIYRSLCDTRGEKRRSDLTTVFLMRKDRTQEDAHVFELHAALLARTSWDYSDETGGLFSYGTPTGTRTPTRRVLAGVVAAKRARGPRAPWKRIDGW
ncbi:hypothetical protein JL720_6849 [Aureococcus anophagefferens]|nr:hypothetical protein JL720_6849 [Aureococcus anophagefferens]